MFPGVGGVMGDCLPIRCAETVGPLLFRMAGGLRLSPSERLVDPAV